MQHLHYFSVCMCEALRHCLPNPPGLSSLFMSIPSPRPPFYECFPSAEKNWVPSKSSEKGLLFCPKLSIASAVIWQQEHGHPHS